MPSNKAKGTAYEKFTQSLFQTLHDADGYGNVVVEQDKSDLVGNSGCSHQLDVYWEFEKAGVKYRTAIECKAFDKPVPIGRVRDFYGVLADVPNLRGVFVSMFGFQSGAKQYAKHYGIDLKELREPTEADWDGRIENINLRVTSFHPDYASIRPQVTTNFIAGVPEGVAIDLSFAGMTNEAAVFDQSGKPVATINEIFERVSIDHLVQAMQTYFSSNEIEPPELEFTVPFPNNYWRSVDGELIPIDAVTVRYDYLTDEEAILLGKQAALAIMQDLETGRMTFFNKNGGFHHTRN